MKVAKLLAQQPRRDALERSDQSGQGYFGRVVDQQMHVVVVAVELHQLGIKILADTCENQLHGIEMFFVEHVAPILGYEYQMNMEGKYAMSSVA